MPYPIVDCPFCHQKNSISLIDLNETDVAMRDAIPLPSSAAREYRVVCKHCGKAFKITLNRPKNDERW